MQVTLFSSKSYITCYLPPTLIGACYISIFMRFAPLSGFAQL